jgi:hypothetical protein
MDVFFFPIIFSIRAAISILLLLRVFSVCTVQFALHFVQDLYHWSRFLSWLMLSSYAGKFWWSLIQVVFVIPITFYTFFRHVYDFGPRHRKRSFLDILWNPVPGVEFDGRLGESNDYDSLRRRRFNHGLLARRILRQKRLTQRRTTQSTAPVIFDCRISYIDSDAPRLYGYETYFTMHSSSMGKQVTAGEHSMPMTLYFAICRFSCPDIVFSDLPRMPPKGMITNTLLSILITGIFGVMTLRVCVALTKQKLVAEIRAIRWTDRLIQSAAHQLPINDQPTLPQSSWDDGMRTTIKSMALALRRLPFWMRDFVSIVLATEFSLSNARNSCGILYLRLSCVKVTFLREFGKCLHKFFSCEMLDSVHAFPLLAYTTMADRLTHNPLSSFDTDSSFWVCDNSATGHICNTASLFTNELVPSIFEVGSATGISTPTLMGNLTLRLTDNEGVKHSFTLENVNYLPDSPVNILSLRRLAELYPDENGHPDRNGTGINSGYDSHTLFWDKARFNKTFHTASSGLPECLFSSGYSKLDVFSTMMSRVYDDTINWAFTSKDKLRDLAQVNDDSSIVGDNGGIVYADDNGITLDVPMTLTNLTSFFNGMHLRYNDGKGTRDIVKFLGADFVDDMQIKCSVQLSDDTVLLVDPETLNFIENPDVASIPQTSDDYLRESANISRSQLDTLLSPKSLSPLQEEMLSYHNRLHHTPFPKLIVMAQQGILPKRLASLKGRCPLCVACLFGQAHKRPWRSKSKQKHPIRKPSDDAPGKRASMDQLVSAQPGLIPQMSGRLTNMRIMGATVFVDHYSDHIYVYLMKDLTLSETLMAKHAYERFLASLGVDSKAYHADNGRFADKGFRDDCAASNQAITFCGVGSHHQNGIAERKIKDITLGGRTLLLHAKRMFPEYISTILWPFAVKCYEDRMNHLVHRADGRTSFETLASLDSSPLKVSDFHTFGCPCYVLDHRLQSGLGQIPKWEPRSRMGIYVGRSPSHASNVGLILNPRTGHVSPQFHVVYDDDFTTVPYLRTATVPPHWAQLIEASSHLEVYTEKQVDTWHSLPELEVDPGDFSSDSSPAPSSAVNQDREGEHGHSESVLTNVESPHDAPRVTRVTFSDERDNEIHSESPVESNSRPNEWRMPDKINLDSSGLRRSARSAVLSRRDKVYSHSTTVLKSVKRSSKHACLVLFSSFCTIGAALNGGVHSHQVLAQSSSLLSNAIDSYHRVNSLYDGTINCFSTLAQSSVASNETFNYKEALQQSDKIEFVKAMVHEVDDHESRKHWTLIRRSDLPDGTKTIMAIWSFKRKRYPDGTLNKHKARLCAHGGMQTWGQNYWETYAPVVNWASVRILLAVAKIHGLPSKSIDFVLAFPQADLEVPVYMELPLGFDAPHNESRKLYVLRLNKSLYGLKQAGYNWFAKLSNGLEDRGFVPSSVDPCVFFGKGCIVLTYVDDCIIVADSMNRIDALLVSLHGGDEHFVLQDEGSIDKYLGVNIQQIDKDSFELTQPFLIERITSFLGIADGKTNEKLTPVGKPLLNKDLLGVPRKYDWEYRGAIGMLTYLTGSVRPDIAMATHQCARFSVNPMRSHEQAVMRIGRYLLSTKEKGMIYRPDSARGIEVFVDADFAGGWDPEDALNADNVYSRTGYVICYAGCPIFWQSKLQTEIALSTAEAEYIALSQALRETIPMTNLMREMNVIFPLYLPQPKFVLKVREDNQSCIAMTNNPKFTPRTKHIAIKYHHFRKHVKTHSNPDGFIEIEYCQTEEQVADIFTKPVRDDIFFKLRFKMLNW